MEWFILHHSLTFCQLISLFSDPTEVSVMSPNRVLEGDNVSLICNVSGNPHPNVAWVRASDNSVLINNSKALLTNINRTESGVFHCLAWNGIGANASSNISIDVLCEYVFNKEDLKVTLVLIPSEVN